MNKYKVCVYAICKNESQFVERWLRSMSEADVIVVLDTGSSDNTVELLKSTAFKDRTIIVHQEEIKPWRFDVARNISLSLIPKDVDICVCTDLDEVWEPGWRDKIESSWTETATRGNYQFIWDRSGTTLLYNKIHKLIDYKWYGPVHENLTYSGKKEEIIWIDGLKLIHLPDDSKPRSSYLPLLELAVEEMPNNSWYIHYLGREYFFYRRWKDCIDTSMRCLDISKWDVERSSAALLVAKSHLELGDQINFDIWIHKSISECSGVREPYVTKAMNSYLLGDWPSVFYYTMEGMKITTENRKFDNIHYAYAWNEDIYDLAGMACYWLGMYEKSYEYFSTAIEMNYTNMRLRDNLNWPEAKLISMKQSPTVISNYVPEINKVVYPGGNIHYPLSPEEILNIPSTNRIFIFWQSVDIDPSPVISIDTPVVSLCIETLLKTNPSMHLFFINHYNMKLVLDDLSWEQFLKLKIDQQSDILMVSLVLKYGGISIDPDTVFTGNIDWVMKFEPDTLVVVGERAIPDDHNPSYIRPHVNFSFFATQNPNNKFLKNVHSHQKNILVNMNGVHDLKWNDFGDNTSDIMISGVKDPNQIFIINRWRSYIHSKFGHSINSDEYVKFWFQENDHISIDDIISLAENNFITLSNSYTPDALGSLSRDEFLSMNSILPKLIRHIITSNTSPFKNNPIIHNTPRNLKSCKFVNEFMMFFMPGQFADDLMLTICCTNSGIKGATAPGVKFDDSPEKTLDDFISVRSSIVNGSYQRFSDHCDNCYAFNYHNWKPSEKIRRISFGMYPSICQAKCCYCYVYHRNDENNKFNMDIHGSIYEKCFSVLDVALQRGLVADDAVYELSTGEITINPFKDRILDYVEGNIMDCLTNCFIFDLRVAQNLKSNPMSKIVTSIDSGTSDTWLKVKGVDNFDEICNVILKYRSFTTNSDQIVIKYILLPGLNDNESDFDGVINLLRKSHLTKLRVARCTGNIEYPFDATIESCSKFVAVLWKNNINIEYDAFTSQHIDEIEQNARLLS